MTQPCVSSDPYTIPEWGCGTDCSQSPSWTWRQGRCSGRLRLQGNRLYRRRTMSLSNEIKKACTKKQPQKPARKKQPAPRQAQRWTCEQPQPCLEARLTSRCLVIDS